METVLPEKIPPEKSDVEMVFQSLDWAKQNGLEYEFMEFFLLDYRGSGDVFSAIAFANREWDL